MKAGALFAGIGGFCAGFHDAGIGTAWAIDNDSFCNETYQKNINDVRLIPEDIQSVFVHKHDLEPVDILHAGFPLPELFSGGWQTRI